MKEQKQQKLDIGLLDVKRQDCLEGLKSIEDNSIDLVFTSPPYADQRKGKYDSIPVDEYVDWFVPIAVEIQRALKPSGSFFLNLSPHCEQGEKSTYVMELVIAIRDQAKLRYMDELVWYKSANPRKWDHRLKNAWEPIYQFAKERPYINHANIKIPTESAFVNKRGYSSYTSVTGNVGGYHEITDQGIGFTIPDNVLYFPSALLVKDKFEHPAKFPLELAEFFVRGFCPEGGTVLDPFMGSGTTGIACWLTNRNFIGIEQSEEYMRIAEARIGHYSKQQKLNGEMEAKP